MNDNIVNNELYDAQAVAKGGILISSDCGNCGSPKGLYPLGIIKFEFIIVQ